MLSYYPLSESSTIKSDITMPCVPRAQTAVVTVLLTSHHWYCQVITTALSILPKTW